MLSQIQVQLEINEKLQMQVKNIILIEIKIIKHKFNRPPLFYYYYYYLFLIYCERVLITKTNFN